MRFWSFLFATALLLASCQEVAEVAVTEHLTLVIKEMSAEEDTFLAVLQFKESTRYTDLIQEVEIRNGSGSHFKLVETFDTSWVTDGKGRAATVGDRHWNGKVKGWEHRRCRFYAGRVKGVDRDSVGFAMLPQNMDGSFRTKIPYNVNEQYQKGQDIRGRIVERHLEAVDYTIDWKPNYLAVATGPGSAILENGVIRYVKSPVWLAKETEKIRLRRFLLPGIHRRGFHIPPEDVANSRGIPLTPRQKEHQKRNRQRLMLMQNPHRHGRTLLPEGVAEEEAAPQEEQQERSRARLLQMHRVR